jgi:TrmH family RNA methyltransferase
MGLSKEKRKLLSRLRDPRQREKAGAFMVEGIRGTQEFLHPSLPLEPRFALTSPRLDELQGGSVVRGGLAEAGIPVEALSDDELRAASATENPQGVVLVVREPSAPSLAGWEGTEARILVLDGIQDPGNVGTLVRGARAFGLSGVVVLDGTADPWGPKAVRASAGALAHTPLWRMGWEVARDWMEGMGVAILAASAEGEPVGNLRPPGGWALVVGNEGAGVRGAVRRAAVWQAAVPMARGVDSLNVAAAGAILLYALTAGSADGGGS